MRDAASARLARLPGIAPDWSVSDRVHTLITIRTGGVSAGDFGAADGAAVGLNLGEHVGDDPAAVRENRARLQAGLPGPICWLQQVHGVNVHQADSAVPAQALVPPTADAAITMQAGQVLAIMTADCLPLLLADKHGRIARCMPAGEGSRPASSRRLSMQCARASVKTPSSLPGWGPPSGRRRSRSGKR